MQSIHIHDGFFSTPQSPRTHTLSSQHPSLTPTFHPTCIRTISCNASLTLFQGYQAPMPQHYVSTHQKPGPLAGINHPSPCGYQLPNSQHPQVHQYHALPLLYPYMDPHQARIRIEERLGPPIQTQSGSRTARALRPSSPYDSMVLTNKPVPRMSPTTNHFLRPQPQLISFDMIPPQSRSLFMQQQPNPPGSVALINKLLMPRPPSIRER